MQDDIQDSKLYETLFMDRQVPTENDAGEEENYENEKMEDREDMDNEDDYR
jgi:hypothetical protein